MAAFSSTDTTSSTVNVTCSSAGRTICIEAVDTVELQDSTQREAEMERVCEDELEATDDVCVGDEPLPSLAEAPRFIPFNTFRVHRHCVVLGACGPRAPPVQE